MPGYADLVEIGRGGDSVVYRARQESLNRAVAIKVLLLDDDETVARFDREIAITVDLGRQHPNIMTVLATGTTDSGRPAIVMDHYERGSLDQRLRENGPFPAADVVTIGCVLADALQFAHEHGVLHRDVKPQNVMILPTSYVLGDFGIARLADSEHTASAERFTVRHASPQILDGHPPTASDDVWSLGSTLFTLLDGRTPFASEEPGEDTALAYLRRARTEPHRRLPDSVDPALVAVIDRALEKGPARRWPDAASLGAALQELRGAFLGAWSPEATGRAGSPEARPDAASDSGSASAPAPGSEAMTGGRPDPWAPAAAGRHAARDDAGSDDTGSDDTGSDAEGSPTRPRPHTHAPAEATPEAEPVAVALSVLAHEPSAAPVDAEPTGVVPGAGAAPATDASSGSKDPADPEATTSDEPSKRSPGRVVLALGAVALAVGVTLGALGGILRQDDPDTDASTTPTETGNGIETLDAPPSEDGDDQPIEPDDSIRPVITNLTFQGTSIELIWEDRSGGEAEFVVAQTFPEREWVAAVEPGVTEYTVEGVDPDVDRICFLINATMPDGRVGPSEPRCWPPGGKKS